MGRRGVMSAAFVVMGVSGCGKSSVAERLAAALGGDFLDADDFHSPANKAKMSAGIPLQDEDRWGWLDTLNAELRARSGGDRPVFLACSALRRVYRERIAEGIPSLRFLYLKGSRELIAERLAARTGHFMAPTLLESQFAVLEEPDEKEAVVVGINHPLEEIVGELLSKIG